MIPPKAVISDLGGVLIDYSLDLVTAEWARRAGIDPHELAGRLVIDDRWERFEVAAVTEQEFCTHLRRQCGFDLSDEDVLAGWNAIYIGINAEVERLLRDVASRGVRAVAITNTNVSHQRVWRERFAEVLELFDTVYSSCDLRARKPERRLFEHVLAAEGLAPHEAVFIDDFRENIEGAERVGIDGILYTDAASLRDAFAARGLLGKDGA